MYVANLDLTLGKNEYCMNKIWRDEDLSGAFCKKKELGFDEKWEWDGFFTDLGIH